MLGPIQAIAHVGQYWAYSLTMMVGSLVAGGTSMGGGAVAFPVLTKLLQVSPENARLFSLSIQTLGMGASTLTIVALRLPVIWPLIRWVSVGGLLGQILGTFYLASIIPSNSIRMLFTTLACGFAISLIRTQEKDKYCHYKQPIWGLREKIIILVTGIIGGCFSALVGSGIDIVSFSVMVLLFRLCKKISTATSVIVMAFNAAIGFALHLFIVGDFIGPVVDYWLAAVPVVVIGAPLGAILCSYLTSNTIVRILLGLITVEFISSILLVPLNSKLIVTSFVTLLFTTRIYCGMNKITWYRTIQK